MNIGFYGGNLSLDLGPPEDVISFFECLQMIVTKDQYGDTWPLLTDRLYRRYLRIDEIDTAGQLMNKAREEFTNCSTTAYYQYTTIARESFESRLDFSKQNLADVYEKYFKSFFDVFSCTKLFLKSWNIYKPVIIVITDMPEFICDIERPLEAYDQNDGPPFWMRALQMPTMPTKKAPTYLPLPLSQSRELWLAAGSSDDLIDTLQKQFDALWSHIEKDALQACVAAYRQQMTTAATPAERQAAEHRLRTAVHNAPTMIATSYRDECAAKLDAFLDALVYGVEHSNKA